MKSKQTMTFTEWLQAMPKDVASRKEYSSPLVISLDVRNWMVLREASIHEGKTMDQVASDILANSDELMEKSTGESGE